MEYGATINLSKRLLENELFVATRNSASDDVIKLLIESDPAHFLFAKTSWDETALHIACKIGLSVVIVQWLIEAGTAKNSVDAHGRSPMHHAALGGHIEPLQVLLERAVDLDIKDNLGRTALDLAIEEKKSAAIVALVGKTYLYDTQGNTTLHLASAIDNADALQEWIKLNKTSYLFRKRSVNDLNNEGESALHIATKKKLLLNMRCLLDEGADVNLKTATTGRTPLHYAAVEHSRQAIELLLKRGGDREISDFSGAFPRDLAIMNGPRTRIAELGPVDRKRNSIFGSFGIGKKEEKPEITKEETPVLENRGSGRQRHQRK
jgi:serine/threonine-protein phosphatase 6 regulatory ankyrin repeat subunit B